MESINQVLVFLYIAQGGTRGMTVSDVMSHYGMSQSAASRACRFLTSVFNSERQGVDLVECYNDSQDRRIKWFRLNPKGTKAIAEMGSPR